MHQHGAIGTYQCEVGVEKYKLFLSRIVDCRRRHHHYIPVVVVTIIVAVGIAGLVVLYVIDDGFCLTLVDHADGCY